MTTGAPRTPKPEHESGQPAGHSGAPPRRVMGRDERLWNARAWVTARAGLADRAGRAVENDLGAVYTDPVYEFSATGPLPAVMVDMIATTQPELEAIVAAPPRDVPLVDGVPLDEVATERMPAVTAAPPAEHFAELVLGTVKRSGIYAISALSAPLVSLILAPFLAHHLSLADYGRLALINTFIGLAAGVTQMGLGSAFFRAYNYDYTDARDRRAVIGTILSLLGMSSGVILAVCLSEGQLVDQLVFHYGSHGNLVGLSAIAILTQNLSVPAFAWMRAEGRAGFFSGLSIASLIVSLVANIVLVGVLQRGIEGAILATASGYGAVVVIMLPAMVVAGGMRFRRDVAWNMISFGAPQILSFIGMWILQLSDRYLLTTFSTLSVTARYDAAYKLGGVLATVIISPFQLAWPTAMYAIAKRADAGRIYRLVFRWYSMLLLVAAFALSLVSTGLLEVLFPATYSAAAPVIPIVAESIAFYGVYNIFMIGTGITRKTWIASVLVIFAALLNFGLNLLLIPRFGAMGAAASTLVAYAALAALAYAANQRIYPIPFDMRRFLVILSAGIVIYLGCVVLWQVLGPARRWHISILGLLLYATFLLWTERQTLSRLLRARLRATSRTPRHLEAVH